MNQDIPGDSTKIILKNAKSFYEKEDYIETIVKLKWLIPYLKNCDKAPAYEYLAYSYVKLGDEENAIETFKELLSISPEYEPIENSISTDIIEVFRKAKKNGHTRPGPVPVSFQVWVSYLREKRKKERL